MRKLLTIKRSLISVSDKKNISRFAKKLLDNNVEIITTGNTYKKLKQDKLKTKKIEKITNFPEILSGRVKTLHPNIFGGILANMNDDLHKKQIKKLNIEKIQLLVVNLYPFEEVIKKQNSIETCIENIDVGGPSLIRAAAKNYQSTAVVVDINDYKKIIYDIEKYNGITLELRKYLAVKAFNRTMHYDKEIYNWFETHLGDKRKDTFSLFGEKIEDLRYGENPHQKAAIYKVKNNKEENFYEKLNGKDLSFNNLNDLRAALGLINEFTDPTSVIIKHAIPCGVCESKDILQAWKKALNSDKLSAFGGVVAFNRIVDTKLALQLSKIFLEVIAAPGFSKGALKLFKEKSNLRIVKVKKLKNLYKNKPKQIITMPGVFLIQDGDASIISKKNLKIVSEKKPNDRELDDLLFANKVVKHVRSNAIVLAKNKVTLGIGSGNTSRVDSVNFAIIKSKRSELLNKKNILNGSVMASDAFFPFSDSISIASKEGVKSIIQPGGSVKDKLVIDEVNKKKMSMIFTNLRTFIH